MEFVEGDDGPAYRRPPDPDDRLWRHPSEIGGSPRSAPPAARLANWGTGAASALGVAVVAATALTMVGTLGGVGPATGPAVSSATSAATPVAQATTGLGGSMDAALDRVGRSVVAVQVLGPDRVTSVSGVALWPGGLVVTVAHAVTGRSDLSAVLSDGSVVGASLVGADPATGVAVVRVGADLPPAATSSSASLRVGAQAVAVGAPSTRAGGPSVATGSVMALDTTVPAGGNAGPPLFGMIETDIDVGRVAVAGGALLDGQGMVVGIATDAGTRDRPPLLPGQGHAIPVELAQAVGEQIAAHGHAAHGWLGIEGHSLEPAQARTLGLAGGAVVGVVNEGGPAASAGIAEGDVVVAVRGRPVRSIGALVVELRMAAPGAAVEVEVVRGGGRRTFVVILAGRPAPS